MPSGVNLFCIFVNSPPKYGKIDILFISSKQLKFYHGNIHGQWYLVSVLLVIFWPRFFERLSFYFLSKTLYTRMNTVWLAWWKMAFNLSPPSFSVILILGIQSWFIAHMEKVVAWLFYYIVALFLLAFLSWVAQVMKNWCIRHKRRKSFPHSGDVISPMSQKHCRTGHVSRIVTLVSLFGCGLCDFSVSPAFRFCGNTDQMGWKKCDKPSHCQDPCFFRSKHILSNWPFWAQSLF